MTRNTRTLAIGVCLCFEVVGIVLSAPGLWIEHLAMKARERLEALSGRT